MQPTRAKFQIGQIVRHRIHPFRGVIFDVDPVFANTEDWYASIPEDARPDRDQPFYHLLAEVLNNIVEHGYPDRPPGLIHVSIVPSGKGLSCAVADDGTALPTECLAPRHDPLTRASMNRPRSEESFLHLPEGGFGWVLIQGLTTNLCHYRENGRNILAFYLGEVDALV